MNKFKKLLSVVLAGGILLTSGCSAAPFTAKVKVTYSGGGEGSDYISDYEGGGSQEVIVQQEQESELKINSPTKTYYSAKYVYDFLGEDVMPIGGYIEPLVRDSAFTVPVDQAVTDFAGSGCNLMIGVEYSTTPNGPVKGILEECEKNNVMYLPRSVDILPKIRDKELDEEEAKTKIYYILKDFYKYKSYAGMHVADEPGYLSFDYFKTAHINFNKAMNGRLFFINLLPIYSPGWAFVGGAGGGGSGSDNDYMKYYTQYMEKVNPKVLCYDYYPIEAGGKIKKQYFYQMTIIKNFADAAKIPFWTYIQVCNWGNGVDPSYSEIAWQVNTSIAMGAKGIQYFTYMTPHDYLNEHYSHAMVSSTGEKLVSYYDVQKVNRHIKAVDEWTVNSTVRGIIQTGANANEEKLDSSLLRTSYKRLGSVSGSPSLVSCMDHYVNNNSWKKNARGITKEVYYVVNNTIKNKGNVTLNFTEDVSGIYIKNGETFEFSGAESLALAMDAGEAIAVVLD